MSATFNWSYRPGVPNKYGITIAASADDVKPSNCGYVALFGNDITGNGSRQKPWRTISRVPSTYGYVIIAGGVYREVEFASENILVGDGDVIIDGTQLTSLKSLAACNIKFRNLSPGSFNTFRRDSFDCIFENVINSFSGLFGATATWINTILNNANNLVIAPSNLGSYQNTTFYKCDNVQFPIPDGVGCMYSLVFHSCNLWFKYPSFIDYSLFYNCKFAFGGNSAPAMSSGYISLNTIADLRAAHQSAFETLTINFPNCLVTDPKFNNVNIGDFSLAIDSPAKSRSYRGTFIGARSIGQSIRPRVSEVDGAFELENAINLTTTDDSIILTDRSINGQVDTKPIINLPGREILSLPTYGINADRNGQYIDSIADLSPFTYSAGDTLPIPMPFIVETGAINYNGSIYQAGERGTTTAAATSFTTVANGVIREILEAPQRHTVMARFSDGGENVMAGSDLTIGYYYFVASGSVTYEGTTYNINDVFKATTTAPFSGTGTIIVAFSTESFQHYEPGAKPTSNNIGDSRTGAIIRGNGDPAYVRGELGVKEFPINAKFIQIRYIIRTSNLKP